ncbi:U3 small nucleolar RNA-associated protein 11 [Fragilariopsis cylindrus CCMP1102]|uniref:U3 small nucleolar RNA-associated protein 11 n=1 Tax=Fragilariopsis cylindrus CCMP1102 TaxID=635003 RepID=A0A1E7FAD5_9STRA|nr:U3 small nucleolar RNA-associated protein 11 [Fragilariopsis cylindrus CCMP1102]|eukprot:OEU15117.1 U3 small nucleolar RNA-associated protein 11 [Fragilariopsis cylindrus CCMP1102]
MSSLRNAVKRIAHKERSQPVDRQHLGILEKKKDYKQRAIDYHRKEDRKNAMKQKASMRNPDEFYFGMHNSKMEDGKHKSNEDYRNLSPDLVKVMKDQDLSYIRMQKQKDTKKAERLQAFLHLLDSDGVGTGTHTVFVGSKKDAREFNVADHFGTIPEMAGRAFNRLRKSDIEKLAQRKLGGSSTSTSRGGNDDVQVDDSNDNSQKQQQQKKLTVDQLNKLQRKERKLAKTLAKARSGSYKELESRRDRADQMKTAEDHLVTEKLVAGKGRKRKVKAEDDGRPAQYKWRRKRLG